MSILNASPEVIALSAQPFRRHEYQRRLLTTLIRWTSFVFAFGIFINSLWLLLNLWNTLAQNTLALLLLLIGFWCIRQTNQGKVVLAGRVYLASAMGLISLLTLILGERFILNAVIGLGLFVFIATFLEAERVALRWGALGVALYVTLLTVRIFLPVRAATLIWADLIGLYAFPMIALSAFALLGSNVAKLLSATLAETQAAHHELERSYQALQGTEAELATAYEQARRELAQRKLAEESLELRIRELDRSRGFIAALNQVAARIDAASGADRILDALGAELSALGMTCVVALMDPEDQALVVRYTSIQPPALALIETVSGIALLNHRVRRGAEIVRGMIRRGYPQFMVDAVPITTALLRNAPLCLRERLVRMLGLGSGAATVYLPLTVGHEVEGALVVWGQGLEEDDVPALSVFASQVATALQTAKLHETEERCVEELDAAYQRLQQMREKLVEAKRPVANN